MHARAELPHKLARPATMHPAEPHQVGAVVSQAMVRRGTQLAGPKGEGTTDQALTTLARPTHAGTASPQ